jgi:hypothetical protein
MTIPLKNALCEIISKHTNINIINTYQEPNIWDPILSTNSFTFIDLIKGIIPRSLSSYIRSFNLTNASVLKVLDEFIFILQELTKDLIWNRRCKQMLLKERSFGITKRDKRKPNTSYTRNYSFRNNIDRNSLKLEISNYGLIMECRLGIQFLNFILIVNYPLFTCQLLASLIF